MVEIVGTNIHEFYDYHEEYDERSLDSLIKELQKIKKKEDFSDEDYDKIVKLEDAIAEKLGLVSRNVFESWQEEVMKEITEELNNIMAKLRNHRHDYSKTYTGKAEY